MKARPAIAAIEQHGGSVELIDAEPDEAGRVGACFTFTLPLRSPDEAPDETAEMSNDRAERPAASEPAAERQEEPPVLAVEQTVLPQTLSLNWPPRSTIMLATALRGPIWNLPVSTNMRPSKTIFE